MWNCCCTQTLTLVRPGPERDGDLDVFANKPAGKQKKDSLRPDPSWTWTLKGEEAADALTGVHVCSVGQWLCLPPIVNGLFLLLLQDETTQVGLDLDSPQTQDPSVITPGCYYCVCVAPDVLPTNLFQLLLLQRPGLVCQVFKLIFLLLDLLLPPLDLCNRSTSRLDPATDTSLPLCVT